MFFFAYFVVVAFFFQNSVELYYIRCKYNACTLTSIKFVCYLLISVLKPQNDEFISIESIINGASHFTVDTFNLLSIGCGVQCTQIPQIKYSECLFTSNEAIDKCLNSNFTGEHIYTTRFDKCYGQMC